MSIGHCGWFPKVLVFSGKAGQTACDVAITWFDHNLMQANPEKFHFLVLSPFQGEAKHQHVLDLPGVQLNSVTEAPLLGITIDNELKFNTHVKAVCKKVNFQLFTLKRMSWYMDVSTKLTIFKSFIASNFSYCCHISDMVLLFAKIKNTAKQNPIQRSTLCV